MSEGIFSWGPCHEQFYHDHEVVMSYAAEAGESKSGHWLTKLFKSTPKASELYLDPDPSVTDTIRQSLGAAKSEFVQLPLSELENKSKPAHLDGFLDLRQQAAIRAHSEVRANGLLKHEIDGPVLQVRGFDLGLISCSMGISHPTGRS